MAMEGAAVFVLPVAALSALRRWNVRQGAPDPDPSARAGDSVAAEPEAEASSLKRGSLNSREFSPQGLAALFDIQHFDLRKACSEAVASMGGSSSEASDDPNDSSPEQFEDALQAMSEFCEGYSAVRVAPTPAELRALWQRCSDLDASAISAAIYEQLSRSGTNEWQQQLRALHVLEYLLGTDGVGLEAAHEAFSESQDIIRHLSVEVPQCSEAANRVLVAQAPPQDPPGACEKVFLVFSEDLASRTSGLAYRICKRRKHKDNLVLGPRWGTTVRGVDQRDGWLRVGNRVLPMALNGKQVLFEQEEDEVIASYAAAVDLALPRQDSEVVAAGSSSVVESALEAPFEAALPAARPAAPQGILQTNIFQDWSELEGLRFSEEACPTPPPLSELPASAWTTTTAEGAPSKQRYLWLSAVDSAIQTRPDPFAFASAHAFNSGVPVYAL